MTLSLPNLKDYSVSRLRSKFVEDGLPKYRADQIVSWMYKKGVDDPHLMTDLDKSFRDRLIGEWSTRALNVENLTSSADGTIKGVLVTEDQYRIETVMIPESNRNTLCVSSQVGCPVACSFCATGTIGFGRNLSTAEIVDQVCVGKTWVKDDERITNIVFMGMGEPLLNITAVLEAIQILIDPKCFGLAPRRVTVSTAGVVPKIGTLLSEVPVHLAVSLHATTDEQRDKLVPLNRHFPLDILFSELRKLPEISHRHPVFFEYTLLSGVNDSPTDALRLIDRLGDLPCKVNLIPWNPFPGSEYRPSASDAVDRFMFHLSEAGVVTTLRRGRGLDIAAACGQLALRGSQSTYIERSS